MCVAVLIESDTPPTSRELALMEADNPHGAGLAWAVGDKIHYRKGMTWGQINALLPRLPRPVLMHFRWATHGPRVGRLTHPFPLGYKAITSHSLRGKANAVLIHNGTWGDYKRYAPNWISAYPETSDTAVAALLAEWNEEILDKVPWCTAVGRAAGGGRMDVTVRGQWEEHNGNLYSNLNWQPRNKIYYNGWGGYAEGIGGYGGDYSTPARGVRTWTPPTKGSDDYETYTAWLKSPPGSGTYAEWKARRQTVIAALAANRGERIVDAYPEEIIDTEDLGPISPIGMVDIPEETPQEVRDQLLLEESPRIVARPAGAVTVEDNAADVEAITRFLDDMFPEYAEVQLALQGMEERNPSASALAAPPRKKCSVLRCDLDEGHKEYGHYDVHGRLVSWRSHTGRELQWDETGKMTITPEGK